jgi:hypothetical protein
MIVRAASVCASAISRATRCNAILSCAEIDLERPENLLVVDADFFRKAFPILLLVKLPPQLLYQLRFLLSEVRFLTAFGDLLKNPRLRVMYPGARGWVLALRLC